MWVYGTVLVYVAFLNYQADAAGVDSMAIKSLITTKGTSRLLSMSIQRRCKYTLPDLPYDYNALEPVISADIMQLHHGKHHAAYVNNLNTAIEQLEDANIRLDPLKAATVSQAIKFNAGGHANHSIFWHNLCPVKDAKGEPDGLVCDYIKRDFGSFDQFKTMFNTQTAGIQGSGWGWLTFDRNLKRLNIQCTANQDPPSGVPLLGVDVWEHAYYLQYKNARPDYLKAIWQIINWADVNKRLSECL